MDRLSSPSSTISHHPEHQKMPQKALVAIGTTIKPMSISGISGMNFSPMSTNSPTRVSMPCLPSYPPSSSNVKSLILTPRKCSKSWSCNMQCDAMRPETGSVSRTTPNSPTSPFLSTVSCLSHAVSSIKGQGKGTSWLHDHYHSDILNIFYTYWHPIYLPPLQQMWLLPPPRKVSSPGKTCYACGSLSHYTALCKWKRTQETSLNTPQRSDRSSQGARSPRWARSPGNNRSRHRWHHSSQSPSRQSCHHSPSCIQSHSTSCSPSHNVSPHWHDRSHHQHTPFWYSQDNIEIIPADSVETSTQPEGFLYTERASDGQVSFFTKLQLPTKHGIKLMTMKKDHIAQVNTIPLSRYQKFYPHKVNETRFPKPSTLSLTSHTWILHDGSPKPFLGHFIAEVQHATLPKL